MKVKNVSKGSRGINTKDGPVLLEPGEEVDVEISEEELKVSKSTEWFEFGAKASTKDEK
jgi:hypothetical protein